MCSIKFYLIILVTIEFVRCADKPGNNDQSLVSYSDSEEEDNFDVTESTEQPETSEPKGSPPKSPPETSAKGSPPKSPSGSPEHVEVIKKSIQIIFMKKDENGIVVPMEEGDYKVTSEDSYRIVYMFQASLEMILYNYEVIFEHVPGKHYTLTLTYYKPHNVFTMQDVGGFIFICCEEGKWRVYLRNRSGYLKFYTKHKGKDFELNEGDYYITFGPKGFLKYEFKKNVKCHRVMHRGKLLWKKEINKPCPSEVSINLSKDIVLYFDNHYLIFFKSHRYKLSVRKPRKKR
ncbi:SVSP family protein [Theileria parva strain Muguga]|uniref:Uncharacterized protein n=1 Tax=Theileria parva TaxID=5875 RepID=Q4N388_THEPA|nr:SVSP family protein [Theileria parva strain Muguga]EAN31451.1 SVSP family protein [Theileria parva strain Muguga]|eukprot:XP_763734.1 hypothetical protein [Theileria parva strain Muguga]